MTEISANAPELDLRGGLGARVRLNSGLPMPVLGLGVWKIPPGAPTRDAVVAALSIGYRLIDTAAMYGNEREVAEGIRASGVPREEVFVTSKLWTDDHGRDAAARAFERSAQALGPAPIDLYLIHWPVASKNLETWRVLERRFAEGRCRSIGVSNFTGPDLEALRRDASVVPAVNQIEFHPFQFPRELLEHDRRLGIQTESYSPLGRGRRLADPTVAEIARRHGRSPAQVFLRWGLERGVIPIPKSVHPERMRENAEVFDFALDPQESAELDRLSGGDAVGR
ncbi:MAG TPA: aldo/keto reductase [Thermoplasmata archaeon]|nr:aldo/keto reductase [Thermoplasmata archaeon]HEV2429555.1 aldo/keto reductase [Thermoplasmata archaeon]